MDSCLVDGLTLSKARIEGNARRFDGNFSTGSAAIRSRKGLHWWLIDFVLVRQVGFFVVVVGATLIELAFPASSIQIFTVDFSALSIVVLGYACLASAALFYGMFDFVRKESVDRNFAALHRDLLAKYEGSKKD
jgi:hypothetical protein